MNQRPPSPAMDAQLEREHKVLDHGFIRVVDYMGDDAAIAQAARVSYGKGTKSVNEDRGLIRYLMRHWHTTPFEMCEIKLHVKLPIFVARQWIRHRTANVNEYSARYSILDKEFYIPNAENMALQSTTNNQGRGELVTGGQAQTIFDILEGNTEDAYNDYERLNEMGLARELSRMTLPTNIYTQWYWKIDLHNLFHFLRLRADPHAQYEIRVYAEKICELIKPWVPHAYEAFVDYQLEAQQFSRMEMGLLKQMVQPEFGGFDEGGFMTQMSDREIRNFREKLGVADV